MFYSVQIALIALYFPIHFACESLLFIYSIRFFLQNEDDWINSAVSFLSISLIQRISEASLNDNYLKTCEDGFKDIT